ncbi:CMRF35-like molecule 2 [Bagarius yarrelli]|uniref:CMRF35-like molecule 2 n=1 Tax=Bagarius yarrelli TaxID=175774 RepID=A0A556TR82_BAGYA|nr:CMRF35-like molecule 2 [Bagarius yarrelli]
MSTSHFGLYPSYEKSISETVHVGDDLTLSCKYPEHLQSYPKFLCKMNLKDSVCSYDIPVKLSVNLGKFYVYDDKDRQMFNVSIRNITEQDAGEFWCGAEVNWKSDNGYKVYITKINLAVTQINLIHHPEFPSVIPVSVVVVVLFLTGISVLLVVLWKMQAQLPTIPNDQGVYSTAQLPTIPNDQGVYSTAKLPTIPNDQVFYSTAKLPTIPNDQDVYSSAQLATIANDQDVYSTAQLATIANDQDHFTAHSTPPPVTHHPAYPK